MALFTDIEVVQIVERPGHVQPATQARAAIPRPRPAGSWRAWTPASVALGV